jgi:hypothetical protein
LRCFGHEGVSGRTRPDSPYLPSLLKSRCVGCLYIIPNPGRMSSKNPGVSRYQNPPFAFRLPRFYNRPMDFGATVLSEREKQLCLTVFGAKQRVSPGMYRTPSRSRSSASATARTSTNTLPAENFASTEPSRPAVVDPQQSSGFSTYPSSSKSSRLETNGPIRPKETSMITFDSGSARVTNT